jgi:predicted DNA-binding protein (UPF0251 family)
MKDANQNAAKIVRMLVEVGVSPDQARKLLAAARATREAAVLLENLIYDIVNGGPLAARFDGRPAYPAVVSVLDKDGLQKDKIDETYGRRVKGSKRYRLRDRGKPIATPKSDRSWFSEEMELRCKQAGITGKQWEAVKLVKGRGFRPVTAATRLRISRQRVHAMVKKALQKLGG